MADEKKKDEKKKDERKFYQKKRYKIGFGLLVVFFFLGSLADRQINSLIEECNKGSIEKCDKLVDTYGSSIDEEQKSKIINPYLADKFKKEAEIKEAKEKKEAEIKAEKKAKAEKEQREVDALIAKRRICLEVLKRSLKDPSSFKEVNSILDQMQTGIIVYSATNSFGGRIQSTFDCNK